MALPRVTLTATYIRPDFNPIQGWVDFCPPRTLSFPDEPTFVACCSRVHLSQLGEFTIDLVATDTPASNFTGEWYYRVHEYLQCDEGGERVYYIRLPLANSPVDLAEVDVTTHPPS